MFLHSAYIEVITTLDFLKIIWNYWSFMTISPFSSLQSRIVRRPTPNHPTYMYCPSSTTFHSQNEKGKTLKIRGKSKSTLWRVLLAIFMFFHVSQHYYYRLNCTSEKAILELETYFNMLWKAGTSKHEKVHIFYFISHPFFISLSLIFSDPIEHS